jgi:hypothetical protein
MQNNSVARVGRRGFLRLGVLAGVAGILGCDGQSAPTQVVTPPVKGGNRQLALKKAPGVSPTKGPDNEKDKEK